MAYNVTPPVPYHAQVTQYDCWHACLKMIRAWKKLLDPAGSLTQWLYSECLEAEKKKNPDPDSPSYWDDILKGSRADIEEWAKKQRVPAVVLRDDPRLKGKEIHPFGKTPGMTKELLPTILKENGLVAVRGYPGTETTLNATTEGIEKSLKDNGPLYCLIEKGYGHVVVVTGISGQKLTILDPENPQHKTIDGLSDIQNTPCVARLA